MSSRTTNVVAPPQLLLQMTGQGKRGGMDQGHETFGMGYPSCYDATHSEQTSRTIFPAAGRPLTVGRRRYENNVGRVLDAGADSLPGRREPVFCIPPWMPPPDFLPSHLAARNAATVADSPHSRQRVVPFSHGGGRYVGRDTRSGDVGLKDGQSHAYLEGGLR